MSKNINMSIRESLNPQSGSHTIQKLSDPLLGSRNILVSIFSSRIGPENENAFSISASLSKAVH